MALFGLHRERNVPTFGLHAAAPLEPVHHIALSPRELRAQAVHRLQVGLFGLGAILLLISLANVIMERAALADKAMSLDPAIEASATAANDPLVDMGVAPELPVGAAPAAPASPPAQQH